MYAAYQYLQQQAMPNMLLKAAKLPVNSFAKTQTFPSLFVKELPVSRLPPSKINGTIVLNPTHCPMHVPAKMMVFDTQVLFQAFSDLSLQPLIISTERIIFLLAQATLTRWLARQVSR